MKQSRKKSIVNVVFVIVLLVTLVVAAVSLYFDLKQSADEDDIGLSYILAPAFTLLFLIPVVMVECDVFYVVRYFMADRAKRTHSKTIMNIIACVLSCGIVFSECDMIFSFDIVPFNMQEILMFALLGAWLVLRVVYAAVGARCTTRKNTQNRL